MCWLIDCQQQLNLSTKDQSYFQRGKTTYYYYYRTNYRTNPVFSDFSNTSFYYNHRIKDKSQVNTASLSVVLLNNRRERKIREINGLLSIDTLQLTAPKVIASDPNQPRLLQKEAHCSLSSCISPQTEGCEGE